MDTEMSKIPALWFTNEGLGPSELDLQLQPIPSDLDGAIPASLGIRVRLREVDDFFVYDADQLVNGGFNLHRSQVVELHRQLGAWLALTPPDVGEPPQ